MSKFTVLFIPRSGFGPVNASTGVAETLQARGHRIIFAFDQSFKGKMIKRGFEEEIVEKEMSEEERNNPSGNLISMCKEGGLFDDCSDLEKFKRVHKFSFASSRKENEIIKEIIERTKPDVIINDSMFIPAIMKSGIPWVNLCSAQILLRIFDERLPPGGLGLPSYDKSEWKKYRDLIKDDFARFKKECYQLLEEDGVKPFPEDRFIESPYLNIYIYPKELDYTDLLPTPPNWYQFDTFIRMNEEHFDLPQKLAQKNGKLVFLSMGSIGSANVDLMKRLISLISDLPYRFIVTKGDNIQIIFNLFLNELYYFRCFW